ncbi:FAD-dependent oxidoreductase [Paraburkholderia sp. J8-2]|uniref:NAD(P)/FAD-dependent oxidoreductase n=1 Tax=Paraburkholderia sp. J8-2 TaxID=2805440 RepID=UPI002AB6457B|nr:FAD-dependent oxidoreductase [Paraburkholderia sp. J8-2]
MNQTIFELKPPCDKIVSQSLRNSKLEPFWLDDAAPFSVFPSCNEDAHADLVIVGGGFLGLWSALMAKERNPARSVILLEGRTIGHAASGRNGGFCSPSITHGEKNGTQRWADEMDQLRRLGLRNIAEFEETLRRYQIDCDFERTGSLTVAIEPYQIDELEGPGLLSQEEVRAEVNSPTYLAGRWNREGSAMLHPAKLLHGLTRVATELGVCIFENSAVAKLAREGHEVVLELASGARVRASRVILATNAYPSLLRRYRYHTIPVYDYVLMTEPLSAAQMSSIGWHHRQGVSDMGNQFHYYRLTRDNRILFGGYDAIYHYGGDVKAGYEDREDSYRTVAKHFFTTFPQLAGIRFTHRWAGAIDTSTQFCAFFATAMRGRVHYGAGFTGLGVGATRFAANVLLDRCEGLSTERTKLRMVRKMPLPFPPEPMRYLSIQLARWSLNRADHNGGRRNLYLRVLDALGLGFDS